DTPLSQLNLATALPVLITQMAAAPASVQRSTVSVAVTASTNVGDGTLVVSVTGSNGVQLDYPIPETISAVCSRDSANGGVAGRETFAVISPVAEGDALNWDYPLGTGLNTVLTAIDATLSNSSGNLLVNSGWDSFTVANTPDKWPILTG